MTVDVGGLVQRAAAGEPKAWDALVDHFGGLVWAVARGHGLSVADAADVAQTTWLRLAEHLHRIREPERIGGWLSTTARNESLRVRRLSRRQVAVDAIGELPDDGADSDAACRLIESERDAALWQAFETLPAPCKVLLRTLMADPAPSYVEVSAALGMPIGSIGPRRNRCLDRLRKQAVLRGEGGQGHVAAARRTAV